MEAAAVACRGRALARAPPGDRAWARERVRRHGVGAGPAARRRLLVASLGEPPSAPSHKAVAVAQEVDEDVASTGILPFPDDPVKMVHVKFVLQKQCAFGQQFLVVGDDPALGLWDPTQATALDWSEGHVWTAKKDLPANKLIEFKFLLQDPSGQVCWQHGSNRTLQITETSNTLAVYEDWDDAKSQKVLEEIDSSIGPEHVFFAGSNGALLTDVDQTGENQETNKGVITVSLDGEKSAAVADADASLHSEKMGANEANQTQLTLDKGQKVPDVLRRKANMVAQNKNPAAAADYGGRNGGDSILYEEGAPAENRPSSIFEIDMDWARKALQRLFRSLVSKLAKQKHEISVRYMLDLPFLRIMVCPSSKLISFNAA